MKKKHVIYALVLLLVMMSEYLLFLLTYQYGSDVNVVAHVGFAGTIVGIILAIVAILYSYYQSFAQQRDAQNLAEQLRQLAGLSGRLDIAANAVSESSQSLRELQSRVHESIALTHGMKLSVEDLSKTVSASLDKSKSESLEKAPLPKPAIAHNGDEESKETKAITIALNGVRVIQLGIYGIIYVATLKKWTVIELGEQVRKIVRANVAERDQKPESEVAIDLLEWVDGLTAAHGWMLDSLGLLKMKKEKQGEKTSIIYESISEAFVNRILALKDLPDASSKTVLLNLTQALALS